MSPARPGNISVAKFLSQDSVAIVHILLEYVYIYERTQISQIIHTYIFFNMTTKRKRERERERDMYRIAFKRLEKAMSSGSHRLDLLFVRRAWHAGILGRAPATSLVTSNAHVALQGFGVPTRDTGYLYRHGVKCVFLDIPSRPRGGI